MDWVIFVFVWLVTVSYYQNKEPPKTVVIGVPDAESKRVFWLAKPEKTWLDEAKEKAPAFFWGLVLGAIGVTIIVLLA